MRIVTWNLNGIRAAHRKGLYDFMNKINSDICMDTIHGKWSISRSYARTCSSNEV